MICIGQKRYRKALELLHNVGELSLVQPCYLILVKFAINDCYNIFAACWHQVVTAPMSSMNAIAVEAYKKYILVSLIHLGQVGFNFLLNAFYLVIMCFVEYKELKGKVYREMPQ